MEELIYELVEYGLRTGLIDEEDRVYRINVLAELLQTDDFEISYEEYWERRTKEGINHRKLVEILEDICEEARKKGILKDDGITEHDLFDTKVMGAITPPPGIVRKQFYDRYEQSKEEATDFYYRFSIASNYIRGDRIEKDEKWITDSEYGPIDISINLSKPEKDPKAIAAAGNMKQSGYPACLLCKENEGFAGRINHPARQNHRIIPITLNGEPYFLQYSPYVYYPEHCIVFNSKHVPMVINRDVFSKLFDFLDLFPHYIIGSNADLPIVGGSILSHDHFQGGHYTFAMARADYEFYFKMKDYPDVTAGIVKWPMSVVRLQSTDRKQVEEASFHILNRWKEYSDESVGIYNKTTAEHNTVTPIVRMRGEKYEIDLVLRNNRTDGEHPWGIFHPTEDLHHIKKENIGLIEVMGVAVLPARLKNELAELERRILSGEDLRAEELTAKHADWAEEWLTKYEDLSEENIHEIVRQEVGKVFVKVLECAGVYKRDEIGQKAFRKFTDSL